MYLSTFIGVVAAVFCTFGHAANVVVINPYLSHSHFAFLVKLTDILADEGHNMTMIINELDTSKFAPLPKKARVIIRSKFSSNPTLNGETDQSFWNNEYEIFAVRKMFVQFLTEMTAQCERFLSDKEFAESMKAEKFDIALVEPTDYCGYGFLKLIAVKEYVNIIPMALAEKVALALGLPGRNFDPFPGSVDQHPGLSYIERISNYALPIMQHYVHNFDDYGTSASVVRQLVDPDFHMNDAVGHARFTFLNTEEHMDFPRPISHKVIYVGGITVSNSSADNLPDDYKQIFDSSKKGVVLVSFGSLAKSATMPPQIKQSFLDMFAAFPDISFIWKYENTSDTVARRSHSSQFAASRSRSKGSAGRFARMCKKRNGKFNKLNILKLYLFYIFAVIEVFPNTMEPTPTPEKILPSYKSVPKWVPSRISNRHFSTLSILIGTKLWHTLVLPMNLLRAKCQVPKGSGKRVIAVQSFSP